MNVWISRILQLAALTLMLACLYFKSDALLIAAAITTAAGIVVSFAGRIQRGGIKDSK